MLHMREQSRRFGDLTSREIRERARFGGLAVIPTGCTEQQGPHLPVDCQTWFAETLMLAAAEAEVRAEWEERWSLCEDQKGNVYVSRCASASS